MSQEARNNAARARDEDLAACAAYVETDAGATGQQNADVLGRLLVDAHARLDELGQVMDRIAQSLENVVAPKLHDLQQLPEKVDEQGVKIAGVAGVMSALMERIATLEDEQRIRMCQRDADVEREIISERNVDALDDS